MKENMNVQPTGTMPFVGAMPQMQSNPNVLPVQPTPTGVSPAMMPTKPTEVSPAMMPAKPTEVSPAMMNPMPVMSNPMGVSPAMMNAMPSPMGVSPAMMNPMPMCCPYLMNMQCPMTFNPNVMGMGMNNPMLTGVSPAMGNVSPAYGPNMGMNSMPGMGMLPSMNPYFGM